LRDTAVSVNPARAVEMVALIDSAPSGYMALARP